MVLFVLVAQGGSSTIVETILACPKRVGKSLRRSGRRAARPQAKRPMPGSTVDPFMC